MSYAFYTLVGYRAIERQRERREKNKTVSCHHIYTKSKIKRNMKQSVFTKEPKKRKKEREKNTAHTKVYSCHCMNRPKSEPR